MKYTFILLVTAITAHAADPEQQLIDLIKRNVDSDFENDIRDKLKQNNVNTLFLGQRFLHFAANYGAINVMQMLYNKGVDVNFHNFSHDTPLHYAAKNGHSEAVTFLLTHDADPSKRNWSKKTPSDLARANRHHEIAKLIDNWENEDIKEPGID